MPGFCWMRREIAQPWSLAMKALSKKEKKKKLVEPKRCPESSFHGDRQHKVSLSSFCSVLCDLENILLDLFF